MLSAPELCAPIPISVAGGYSRNFVSSLHLPVASGVVRGGGGGAGVAVHNNFLII